MLFAWISYRPNVATNETTRALFESQFGEGMFSGAPIFSLRPLAGVEVSDVTYTRDTLSAALTSHQNRHPDLNATAWCEHSGQLPPRIQHDPDTKYIVVYNQPYIATARGNNRAYGDYRARAIMNAADTDLEFYSCAHCARVACEALRSDNPPVDGLTFSGQVYSVLPGYTLLDQYQPPAPEVNGDPAVPNGDTSTNKDVPLDSLPASSCGHCGRPAHNARTCDKPKKAHDRIGIEIEGRWLDLRAMRNKADGLGMTGCGDGSVSGSNNTDAEPYEFQTHPGTVAKALHQLIAMYPDESDKSCGMHVHVSFESHMDVTLLCTPAFFAYFKRRWIAWGDKMNIYGKVDNRGEFWKRLNGLNDYCRENREAPRGSITRMNRYHQLNFSAWSEHKTVECRLLPMFRKASLAVSAVKELVDIFEDFLADPEGCGLVIPSEDISLPIPQLTPYVTEYHIDESDLSHLKSELSMDLGEVASLAPAAGTIRTFRGSVLAGATLQSILAANGITVREAA